MTRVPPLTASPSQQRGAAMLVGALAISTLMATLSVIDLGLLYQYRRDYQRTADLAAMSGVQVLRNGCAGAIASAQQTAVGNLGGRSANAPVIECGDWRPSAPLQFATDVPAEELSSIRVTISGSPPSVLPMLPARQISARAIAVADQPVVALALRSNLLTIDTAQSALLDQLVSGALGGSISLSAGTWTGLLNTDIALLEYLDVLALDLGLEAGSYQEVLATDVRVGEILDATITLLERGGGTGEIGLALVGLQSLALAIPNPSPLLDLGELLQIQTGTVLHGLDANLNVLQLVQGSAQLASGDQAIDIDLPVVGIPGVSSVSAKVRAMDPGAPIAVGNPEWAVADPLGPDGLIVSSSNVRALVSVDLPIVGATQSALQALLTNDALIGITGAVNSLLSLDLFGLVESLFCALACDIQEDIIDVQVLPTPRVDLLVEAGQGRAYVDAFSCTDGKSLDVPTQTAVTSVRLGLMGSTPEEAETNAFADTVLPTVAPIPLVDIGHYRARYQCTLFVICSTRWQRQNGTWTSNKAEAFRTAFSGGGIGIRLGSGDSGATIGSTSEVQVFTAPPEAGLPDMGEPAAWQTVGTTDVVGSLNGTLSNLEIVFFQPSNGNVLGSVLATAGAALNPLVDSLGDLVANTLSPVVDPLVNELLDTLGANLANSDVGANLSCSTGGASLVR